MSESISSSGTRPTCATQTWATSCGPAGHGDRDLDRRAVDLAQQRERELVGVDDRVPLLLPALAGQRLTEVPVAVEQAHADDRHAEVARGLQVVAGQDPEPAGVLRQHRGDAELRREVRDAARRARAERLVPAVAGHVLVEVGLGELEPLDEPLVVAQRPQPRGRDRSRGSGPGRGGWPPTPRRRPPRTGPGSPDATTTAGW